MFMPISMQFRDLLPCSSGDNRRNSKGVPANRIINMTNFPKEHLVSDEAGSEQQAAAELLPLVYEQLRSLAAARMAHERADHTLDATALVHEAYLPLGSTTFSSQSGFFRAAALAMQRILVDHARQKGAGKRGGGKRFPLMEDDRVQVTDPDTLLTIDEALAGLSENDPGAAEVARLRLFAGMSVEEAGKTLGVSRATVFREWAYARAVLTAALGGGQHSKIRETVCRRNTLIMETLMGEPPCQSICAASKSYSLPRWTCPIARPVRLIWTRNVPATSSYGPGSLPWWLPTRRHIPPWRRRLPVP